MSRGKVYLVGAGPGDPKLLTLRGMECLQAADVVLYDALVHEKILEHAEKAELIFVGKRGGGISHSQPEIEEMMISRAMEGKHVVRLKGGDPFLFARGGEEADRCVQAGVDFEVVPGVSAALAVPAYAGIPLTHRDLASSVSFVTAREAPSKKEEGIPWRELSRSDTLVVFMGVAQIEEVVSRLIEAGKSPETPIALVHWGTRPEQQTLVGELRSIGPRARGKGVAPPTLMVIGEVVRLRERLGWFEKKPFFGKRILVTRSRHQATDLVRHLEELGAEAVSFPTIEIRPLEETGQMARVFDRLGQYDWVIFTSVNAVDHFTSHLLKKGRDLRDLKGAKIIAIGPETARKVGSVGLRVDLVPREFVSESIAAALTAWDISGKRFLIPRAQSAREVLPESIRKRGGEVDVIELYQTVAPKTLHPYAFQMIEDGRIDWITFTSSSTVRNFFAMIPRDLSTRLERVHFACIGPVTSETLRAFGHRAKVVPREHTVRGLVHAMLESVKNGC